MNCLSEADRKKVTKLIKALHPSMTFTIFITLLRNNWGEILNPDFDYETKVSDLKKKRGLYEYKRKK